jgi:hypothetical protein
MLSLNELEVRNHFNYKIKYTDIRKGMFLWARLQIDLLSDNAFTSGDLMATLDVVPKTLSDM